MSERMPVEAQGVASWSVVQSLISLLVAKGVLTAEEVREIAANASTKISAGGGEGAKRGARELIGLLHP